MSFLIRQAGHRMQVAGLQFIDEVTAPPSVGDPCLVRIGLQVFLQDTAGHLWPLIPGSDNAGVVTVTAAMSPYAVQAADRYLLINTSAGAVQVNLPAAGGTSVNPIQIVDAARSFGTNALTISGNGRNINGAATLVVSAQDACPILFWGGTTWETTPITAVVPFNPHAPGVFGDVTPSTGAFTALTALQLFSPAGTYPLQLASNPTTGGPAVWIGSQVTQTGVGQCILELSNNGGIGNVGNPFYGAPSAGQSDALCDGIYLNASGAITDSQVVVWAAKNTVSAAGATASLATIAGVALGAAAGNKIRVATRGQVYVNAVAGVSGAGTMLGTSGATAGAVVGLLSTNVGTLLGRSLEATGATVAGKILCQLVLG